MNNIRAPLQIFDLSVYYSINCSIFNEILARQVFLFADTYCKNFQLIASIYTKTLKISIIQSFN